MKNQEKIKILQIAIRDLIKLNNRIQSDSKSNFKVIEEQIIKLIIKNTHYYKNPRKLIEANYYIENYMGKLEDTNLDLIYSLWFTFNIAFTEYSRVKPNIYNLEYERETRLNIAYIKYQAMSKSDNYIKGIFPKIKPEFEESLYFFDD